MYRVDVIKKSESDNPIKSMLSPFWKSRVNLYQLIQKYCDRPAYFWHNYKWSIPNPETKQRLDMTTEEALKAGWISDIYRAFCTGEVDPQTWCNAN